MNASLQQQRNALGHTLLELVLSLVLLSIIFASVGSAVMFAASASPGEDSVEVTMATDSRVISQIAEDLAVAKHILAMTSQSITMIVADRTGDGIPDRIRYDWSGTYGKPLTYQLNDETEINLIDSLAVFNLAATTSTAVRTIPGTSSGSGSEVLIDSYDTVLLTSPTAPIDASNHAGQLITPSLSSGASGFIPSRIEFRAKSQAGPSGDILIQVADAPSGTPTATVYSAGLISESILSNTMTWWSVNLTGTTVIPDGNQIALVFKPNGSVSSTLGNLHYNLATGDMITTTDGGASYSKSLLNTVYYRLYGVEQTSSNAWDVEHEQTTAITISLQSTADARSPLKRNVRLLLAPIALDAYAETDFSTDPTRMDLNADGVADWSHSTGTFPAGSISNGVWTADGRLIFAPDGLSSAEVITVDARVQSYDANGPTIYGPNTIDSSGDPLPLAVKLEKHSGVQKLVIYNARTMTNVVAVIDNLPAGPLDIRLILIPKEETLAIMINHEMIGSVLLQRVNGDGAVDQDVHFGSSGGFAEFGSIKVRVGGTYRSNSDGSGLDLSDLFNLSLN